MNTAAVSDPDLLKRCAKWLKPDGTLEIETPDRRK